MKIKIYKYMAISFAVIAVLCIIIGIIISNKFLPFVGIILISCGIPPLLYPLSKGS